MLSLSAFGSDRATSGLEGALQAKYSQNVMRLRGFYLDGHLHFDSKGDVQGKVHPGAWTLSKIWIEKVRVSPTKVELEGPRVAEMLDPKQLKLVPVRTKKIVHIVVDRDISQPDTTVMNSIEHIFLADDDRLADLVPDYWKAYLSGALEAVPQEGAPDCYRVKGRANRTGDEEVRIPCEEHSKTKMAGVPKTFDASSLPYRIGKNVTPPKAIFAPDPKYVELARLSKFQGITLLELTVTAKGNPADVDIIQPIGFGLDDEGVAAVKTWRFKPATVNGQPVPVRINVEVSFRAGD